MWYIGSYFMSNYNFNGGQVQCQLIASTPGKKEEMKKLKGNTPEERTRANLTITHKQWRHKGVKIPLLDYAAKNHSVAMGISNLYGSKCKEELDRACSQTASSRWAALPQGSGTQVTVGYPNLCTMYRRYESLQISTP